MDLGSIYVRVEHKDEKKFDWSSCDWEQITPRLLLYAKKKMVGYGWRSGNGRIYLSPEDIVHTAIIKTMSGERQWNPEKVDLFFHLIMTIRSILSNLSRSGDNRFVGELVSPEDVQEASPNNPEAIAESRSQLSHLLAFFDENHPDLRPLLDAIVEGEGAKTPELSKSMGLPHREVHNLRRRLQRALEGYRKALVGDGND